MICCNDDLVITTIDYHSLDELDIIEYYQQPGKAHRLSEITEKQRKLYG